ncbi:MAG: hypothetical protein LH702_29895, partial [Phormidesmis sp. CAN_BIN44]|nr:hypothetical protein [Phormidesmis sp. CAN_BIN44]
KLSDSEAKDNRGSSKFGTATPPKPTQKSRPAIPEPVDLSHVNTDNRFIWVALVAVGLIVGGLVWLS